MRIVHISPTDIRGGAMRGAYNLHRALCAASVDSLMLVLRKYGDDPTVVAHSGPHHIAYQALRARLDHLPLWFYDWDPASWWTVGWLPFNITRQVARLNPDVVHFHWAGRGVTPIETLGRLRRYPLVWTLRDMWPLTGGCHYAGSCERFVTGCGRCPQLGSRSERDLSSWQWRRKQRAWRGVSVTYVAPSGWMASCARQSPLLAGNEVHVIPNGVDLSVFKPTDRATARAAWGLPADRRIILFGALRSDDPRKGFVHLAEALGRLAADGWAERALVVVFGANDGADTALALPARHVGRIDDDISLATLYAAADVMVVPSVQENSGKTAIEAMGCGVPVVAFANTGQGDIVDHKQNGYLADNLSAPDLARGIAWCLEQHGATGALGRAARDKALRRFDVRLVAERYLGLYERLVERQVESPSPAPATPHRSTAPAGAESG